MDRKKTNRDNELKTLFISVGKKVALVRRNLVDSVCSLVVDLDAKTITYKDRILVEPLEVSLDKIDEMKDSLINSFGDRSELILSQLSYLSIEENRQQFLTFVTLIK